MKYSTILAVVFSLIVVVAVQEAHLPDKPVKIALHNSSNTQGLQCPAQPVNSINLNEVDSSTEQVYIHCEQCRQGVLTDGVCTFCSATASSL